ncbi:hypothetical protein RF11_06516 [Thelohanellus kitauei]|uniref:Uncharacterized protein n=1 Tax=Thelohanellus kitauei TaxID=669202 RepID=A0A0C2MBM6_THEKT|nr:hypothetical protein RF11_06516 [Thelohanellus kitauei]
MDNIEQPQVISKNVIDSTINKSAYFTHITLWLSLACVILTHLDHNIAYKTVKVMFWSSLLFLIFSCTKEIAKCYKFSKIIREYSGIIVMDILINAAVCLHFFIVGSILIIHYAEKDVYLVICGAFGIIISVIHFCKLKYKTYIEHSTENGEPIPPE